LNYIFLVQFNLANPYLSWQKQQQLPCTSLKMN